MGVQELTGERGDLFGPVEPGRMAAGQHVQIGIQHELDGATADRRTAGPPNRSC